MLRVCGTPGAVDAQRVVRSQRITVLHAEQPHARAVAAEQYPLRILDRLVGVARETHLHIALSADEPDVADQYVGRSAVPGRSPPSASGARIRLRGSQGHRTSVPGRRHRLRSRFRPARLDAYPGAGTALSPQLHVGLLLEHHARGEDGRQFEALRAGRGRAEPEQNDQIRRFMGLFVVLGERNSSPSGIFTSMLLSALTM